MKKVIIIGAGPAGLTAGYELVKDGKSDDFSIERQILHDCDEFERMIIRETMYSLKRSIREHKISK